MNVPGSDGFVVPPRFRLANRKAAEYRGDSGKIPRAFVFSAFAKRSIPQNSSEPVTLFVS